MYAIRSYYVLEGKPHGIPEPDRGGLPVGPGGLAADSFQGRQGRLGETEARVLEDRYLSDSPFLVDKEFQIDDPLDPLPQRDGRVLYPFQDRGGGDRRYHRDLVLGQVFDRRGRQLGFVLDLHDGLFRFGYGFGGFRLFHDLRHGGS